MTVIEIFFPRRSRLPWRRREELQIFINGKIASGVNVSVEYELDVNAKVFIDGVQLTHSTQVWIDGVLRAEVHA